MSTIQINQGQTLLLTLDASTGVLGDVSLTLPDGSAAVGLVEPPQGTKQVRSFPQTAALAPGFYGLLMSFVLNGMTQAATLPLQIDAGYGDDLDWRFGPPALASGLGTEPSCAHGSLSPESTEYVHVRATATDPATGDERDPSGVPVRLAFTDDAPPQEGDWLTASWLRRTQEDTYWARVLMGAGASRILPIGVLSVFIQVGGAGQEIIRRAGYLAVE